MPAEYSEESYPGFSVPVVVKSHQSGRVACGLARFGLIPSWSKDDKISRHTYNARAETVMEKPSFRDAWRKAQHCIIPAQAIFEPDWRSGKAIATRIEAGDGEPFGIAGIWSTWRNPSGEIINSFTMLTINADDHPLMRNFHRPEDEKRTVVILSPAYFDEWLSARADRSARFLIPHPSDQLRVANGGSVD